MLKSQRGVTFLVCVITVIVLMIIGGAVSNTGITLYKNAKVKIFVSEMKMIQEKINLYNDRAQLDSSLDITLIGCSVLDEEQDTYEITSAWLAAHPSLIPESEYEYVRYIDETTEKQVLELKDISRPVLYNYKTKKLYSIQPALVYTSMMNYTEYYSLDELNGN